MWIYDAAMRYQAASVPLIVFAGREYGTGSSRDWAAKGTKLLGVRAVVAQSFERIHRSNLVGMGVLPCVFEEEGTSWITLGLNDETVSIHGLGPGSGSRSQQTTRRKSSQPTAQTTRVPLICRIDTLDELEYFRNGSILALRSAATGGVESRGLRRIPSPLPPPSFAQWCAPIGLAAHRAGVQSSLQERLTEGSAFAARLLELARRAGGRRDRIARARALNFFARAGPSRNARAAVSPSSAAEAKRNSGAALEVAIRDLDDTDLTRFLDSAPQSQRGRTDRPRCCRDISGSRSPHRPAAVDSRNRRERGI